jgi:FkbM family methyltransferase
LGLIKLISLPAQARVRRRQAEYRRKRPAQVEVAVGQYQAKMLVADAIEYARVLSFHEDQHLIQTLLERVEPGDCYWDVGGSIGLYTLLLSQAVGPEGTVVAFEPESRSFQRLSQNVVANRLSNVRPFRIALGRNRQQMKLRVSAQPSSGTHSLVNAPDEASGGDESGFEMVEVIPGDEFREQEQLPIPTALKVDVEGAEEEVLAGLSDTLRHPQCRTAVCEIHFAILESLGQRHAPARVQEFLKACGFTRTVWLDHSHLAAYK